MTLAPHDAVTTTPENADAGNTAVSALAVSERARLTVGGDFWHTAAVGSVAPVMLTDGPHGLRRQAGAGDHLGIGASTPATCFPPATGIASSFDPDLVARVAAAIGAEAADQGVGVVLGPGINIKRSALCGRNFEYFSEDPLLSGELGAAWVRGIQSTGVGASLKHFAANNQEEDRMRSSSDVDERPLREIYLKPFERVVRTAAPWTVMAAYNRINGVYASEDPWLLSTVLRDEWGFDGVVVSDWGAVNDRIAALVAGLDLQMPADGGRSVRMLAEAVTDGTLDDAVVTRAAGRVAALAARVAARTARTDAVDADEHHELAREAAARSVVLLKNDGDILPLAPSTNVVVIGEFARTPRYQGSGSSRITPTSVDAAWDAVSRRTAGTATYRQGYSLHPVTPAEESRLRDDAVAAARAADVVLLFIGLPPAAESEGFDRTTIELPEAHRRLVEAVAAVHSRVVVVLSNGGAVTLPFRSDVAAIVEGWLLGQGGGEATARVLFGEVNPSGRLAETIPLRLEDTPAYLNHPGEHGHVRYGEGVFVGYRWYDARRLDVAYPFGHGLSYTSFGFENAAAAVVGTGDVEVAVDVINHGPRDGRQVVQVYAERPESDELRAPRELVGFSSVAVPAGGRTRATLRILREDLAHWDVRVHGWVVEPGRVDLVVAASSRDAGSTVTVNLDGDRLALPLTRESTMGEALGNPVIAAVLGQAMAGGDASDSASIFEDPEALRKTVGSIPLGRLAAMGGGLGDAQLDALLDEANRAARSS